MNKTHDTFFDETILIETEHGFVPFSGIRKFPIKTKFIKVDLENGKSCKVTKNHGFVVNGIEIKVNEIEIGKTRLNTVHGYSTVVSIEEIEEIDYAYDVLGVENEDSSYFADGIAHHNCSFTGSTATLIEGDTLLSLRENVMDAPYVYEDGLYEIWKRPEKNRIYAFGIDVSQGTRGDYSIVNIFDVTDYAKTKTYEQVGLWRRNDVRLFDFAERVLQLAKEWNDPLIIIENNSGLGDTLVQQLHFEEGYEHLFYDYIKGDYGVNANKKTKPSALGFFKEDVEEGRMKIRSNTLLNELGIFEEVGRTPSGERKYAARKGNSFHDDVVTSSYWISYMLRDKWFLDAYEYRMELIGRDTNEETPDANRDEDILDIWSDNVAPSWEQQQLDFERELWEDD